MVVTDAAPIQVVPRTQHDKTQLALEEAQAQAASAARQAERAKESEVHAVQEAHQLREEVATLQSTLLRQSGEQEKLLRAKEAEVSRLTLALEAAKEAQTRATRTIASQEQELSALGEQVVASKAHVCPKTPVAPAPEQVIAAFNSGYVLAMEQGLPKLEKTLLEKAAAQMFAKVEPSIIERAEKAGQVKAREVVALQAKLKDFEHRYATTKDPKFLHYVEAIKWMLPTNGH